MRTRTRTHRDIIEALEHVITWSRRTRRSVGISASAITTLDSLLFAGPLRVSDLAAREGLSQPGMTSLINRLEGEGLARRATDPADGRASLVSITPAGRERVDAYRHERARNLADRVDELSDSDLDALRAALPALRHLVGEAIEPEQ